MTHESCMTHPTTITQTAITDAAIRTCHHGQAMTCIDTTASSSCSAAAAASGGGEGRRHGRRHDLLLLLLLLLQPLKRSRCRHHVHQ